MSLILCEYVKDALTKNAIAFGFFLAGAVLGVALIMLVYFIYTRLKAKPPKLKKNYEYISSDGDPVVLEAKQKLYSLETKVSIDSYVVQSVEILIEAIKKIACEYTDGKKYLSIDFISNPKYPDLDLSFDADFVVEDFLIFIQEVSKVAENTVLTVTDKYSVLVNSFLRFTGLGQSVRTVTVKDVVLYLNQKAEKSQKKLEKAVEKKTVEDEKKRIKFLRKEEEKNKKLIESRLKERLKNKEKPKDIKALFRAKNKDELTDKEKRKLQKLEDKERKKLEAEKRKEERRQKKTEKEQTEVVSGDNKTSAFNKPINKVITEITEELISGVCAEARKLYGRGYANARQEDDSAEGDENV